MLTYTQRGHIYEIRVESNNLLIGEFVPDIDGFYYFTPPQIHSGRYWNDWTLIELGTKLQEINQEYHKILDNYFKQEKNANTIY